MSRKTPAVAYYNRKIKNCSKSQLLQELKDAPISEQDYNLLCMIIQGKSYKEMAQEFCKSEARIYQWKRTLFEKLHRYDMQNLRR